MKKINIIKKPEPTTAEKLINELAELKKQVAKKEDELKNYFTFTQQEQMKILTTK